MHTQEEQIQTADIETIIIKVVSEVIIIIAEGILPIYIQMDNVHIKHKKMNRIQTIKQKKRHQKRLKQQK